MTRLKELLKKARSVKKSDEILDELFSSIKVIVAASASSFSFIIWSYSNRKKIELQRVMFLQGIQKKDRGVIQLKRQERRLKRRKRSIRSTKRKRRSTSAGEFMVYTLYFLLYFVIIMFFSNFDIIGPEPVYRISEIHLKHDRCINLIFK